MRWLLMAVVVVSCARAPASLVLQPAQTAPTVGFTSIDGVDPIGSKPLKVSVFYPPASDITGVTELGPYRLEAKADVPVAEGAHGLIVISHGHAGSRWGHRDLAEHLARAGYIVAAVEHAGDSWNDQSAFGSDRAMYGRAYQVSATIDAVLSDGAIGPHVDRERIGIAGFSAGGYTSLAVVGASPDFTRIKGYCGRHPTDEEICSISELKKVLGDLKPMLDPRVKAAFAMAPLGLFFGKTAFDAVKVPVFLTWSDHDQVLLPDENALPVRDSLKTLDGTYVVEHAGHSVFLAPCSPQMANNTPFLCEDPIGVDRVAVHEAVNAKAAAFFEKTLK